MLVQIFLKWRVSLTSQKLHITLENVASNYVVMIFVTISSCQNTLQNCPKNNISNYVPAILQCIDKINLQLITQEWVCWCITINGKSKMYESIFVNPLTNHSTPFLKRGIADSFHSQLMTRHCNT